MSPADLLAAGGDATGGNPTDVIGGLIGGAGVAGIWIVTILMGWMHPNTAMKREQARADKAEARVDEMTDVYVKEVIPALNSAAAAVVTAGRHGTP